MTSDSVVMLPLSSTRFVVKSEVDISYVFLTTPVGVNENLGLKESEGRLTTLLHDKSSPAALCGNSTRNGRLCLQIIHPDHSSTELIAH